MIETIQIHLVSGMDPNAQWQCVLEIADDVSLDNLHDTIQQAVRFDNDHLYEFAIGNSFNSKTAQRYFCDSAEFATLTVAQLLANAKGKKLFYIFDYGDYWIFQIKRSRKQPFEAIKRVRYPRLVAQNGKRPKQYR